MNNSELQEKVQNIFDELCALNETIPIIVEGKKDELALRKLGAAGHIIKLNRGQTILNFCEEIAREYAEVIILPDWDSKGKQLFTKLLQNFKINNVKTVKKFWREFKRYCSKDVREVEYLTKFSTT